MRIPVRVPTRLVTGAVFTVALTVASTAALAAQSSGEPAHAPSSAAARPAVTSPVVTPTTSRPAPATSRPATMPPRRPSNSPSRRPAPPVTHVVRPAAPPAAEPAAQPAPVRQSTPRPATTTRTTYRAPAPTTSTVRTPPPPAPVSASNYAWAILSTLNAERAANGLPALRMNSDLIASAHAHNLAMAAADILAHQLPGEPGLATRILNAGYQYYYAGENIAWTSDESVSGVVSVHVAMYNEVPPNDGHRRNILSPNYRDVGIDVVIDAAHGKAWVTEDFGSQQ